jgi:hypothetical protein
MRPPGVGNGQHGYAATAVLISSAA